MADGPGEGRFVVRGGELAVLEGDWHPSRLVILEFPDLETAKAWYSSPKYEQAMSKYPYGRYRASIGINIEAVHKKVVTKA